MPVQLFINAFLKRVHKTLCAFIKRELNHELNYEPNYEQGRRFSKFSKTGKNGNYSQKPPPEKKTHPKGAPVHGHNLNQTTQSGQILTFFNGIKKNAPNMSIWAYWALGMPLQHYARCSTTPHRETFPTIATCGQSQVPDYGTDSWSTKSPAPPHTLPVSPCSPFKGLEGQRVHNYW